jgi:hypothetical protein
MSAVMSKKKPTTPPKDKILTARVPDDLFAAFEAYRAAQLYPPDRTAVVLRLMEQFLRAEGYYPLSPPPPRRPA